MSGNKEGSQRRMTPGEITMARTVFGQALHYNKVWVHCGSYLPFGLQDKNTGMTPNGELYFREETYLADFSASHLYNQHFFIHELTHAWQHQQGMWVRTRGLFSWAANYRYSFGQGKVLNQYSMEQQASIVSDWFLLAKAGFATWASEIGNVVNYQGAAEEPYIRGEFASVLAAFMASRSAA